MKKCESPKVGCSTTAVSMGNANLKGLTADRRSAVSENDSLMLYLKEINRIPLLSREEEDSIAREAAGGSKEARDKLLRSNLRFVVKIAKRYRGMGLPLEDLVSEGNIGLIYALKRYNVEKGYHFISYAVWWIRHFMKKAVCEKTRMIRLPQNKVDSLLRIEGAKRLVMHNKNEKAELREIAQLANMDASQVMELLKIGQDPIFLGIPVYEDGNSASLEDFIEDDSRMNPEDYAVRKILQKDIEEALGSLKKKEADIIRARYGLGNTGPMSLEEVGEYYHMSKEGVRLAETKAIQRLQQPCRRHRLEAYVA